MALSWEAKDKISQYFTYKEALWLPSWQRLATEEDGLNEEILNNLRSLFLSLDWFRELVNKPILVHCAYRPVKYNKQVGGAKRSAHIQGKAVDFSVAGVSPAYLRQLLIPYLSDLKLRLELDTPTWVHVDSRQPYGTFTA
jgi:hypothetical protein